MANFRSGYLKQGDPLGMTQREFQMTKGTRSGKAFRIDPQGLSLIRIMGIEDQSSVETVAVDGLDASVNVATGVVTVTQVGHLLEAGSRIKIKGASGFTNLSLVMGALGNPFQAVTSVTSNTFSYVGTAGASTINTGKIAYTMEAIETPVIINNGVEKNQQVVLECANKSTWSLDVGNIDILDSWLPEEFDTLTLYWDGHYKWVGLSDQIRSGEDIRYQDGVIYGSQLENLGTQSLTMLPAPGVGFYNKVDYIQMDHDEYPVKVAEAPVNAVVNAGDTDVTVTSADHGLAAGDIIIVTAQAGAITTTPVNLVNSTINQFTTVASVAPDGQSFVIKVQGVVVVPDPSTGTIDYSVVWATETANEIRMYPSSGVSPGSVLYPTNDMRTAFLISTGDTGTFLYPQEAWLQGIFYKFTEVTASTTGGLLTVDLSNQKYEIRACVAATGEAAGAGAVKPTGAVKESMAAHKIRYRIKYQVRSTTDLQ